MVERRREPRRFTNVMLAVIWQDVNGRTRSRRARGLNISKSGMRMEAPEELELGETVSVQAEWRDLTGEATVRTCARRGAACVNWCKDYFPASITISQSSFVPASRLRHEMRSSLPCARLSRSSRRNRGTP